MTRQVQVTLPDPVWGRLASRADNLGVTVGELVVEAVMLHEPPERSRLEVLHSEVSAARADGYRSPQRNRKSAETSGSEVELGRPQTDSLHLSPGPNPESTLPIGGLP